jgi:hypothetical protein
MTRTQSSTPTQRSGAAKGYYLTEQAAWSAMKSTNGGWYLVDRAPQDEEARTPEQIQAVQSLTLSLISKAFRRG